MLTSLYRFGLLVIALLVFCTNTQAQSRRYPVYTGAQIQTYANNYLNAYNSQSYYSFGYGWNYYQQNLYGYNYVKGGNYVTTPYASQRTTYYSSPFAMQMVTTYTNPFVSYNINNYTNPYIGSITYYSIWP